MKNVSPRSELAIRGKRRPPKVEKLKGGEQPPPEQRKARRAASEAAQ